MVIQECSASSLSNRELFLQQKLRAQIVEAAAPKLVRLDSVPASEDLLQIQYRGAELKLPAGVDMDAVAALLCSIQSL